MDNQNKQQSGQQSGGNKPQQLSWSQPAAGQSGQKNTSTTPQTSGAPKSRTALIFIIGLIVGWLITWSWFDLRSGSHQQVSSTASSSDSSAVTVTKSGSDATGSNTSVAASNQGSSSTNTQTSMSGQTSSDSVTVPSPQQAGTTVTVSNVSANDTVWAAVYEDQNGQPGRVLGAKRFAPGETSGTIELLRSTLPGLTYYVGLLADTSDHTFGVHTNAPLTDANGKQIMAQFTAQ